MMRKPNLWKTNKVKDIYVAVKGKIESKSMLTSPDYVIFFLYK